jgi:hypothetical protein
MTAPLIPQGQLNRVLTSIFVPSFPLLNVTAAFMSKGQAVLTFDGPSIDQLDTATSYVPSLKPFVYGQLIANIVRSQALTAAYMAQWQSNGLLGNVTIYPDVSLGTGFPPITILNAALLDVDPGAFDGADPTTKLTIRGTFNTNVQIWQGV